MSKIVKYPNSILKQKTPLWDFNDPPEDAHALVEEMITIMNESNGIGLAAPQIGKSYRMFIMRGENENYACFNPTIVYYSPEVELNDEACLSFPGINVKVKRSLNVRLRFQTPSGHTVTKSFSGLTARVIQHELDHLDGIIFINRANKYHRDKAMKGYYNEHHV